MSCFENKSVEFEFEFNLKCRVSDVAVRPTANDVELKTRTNEVSADLKPTSTDNEVAIFGHEDRMSSGSVHYEEILEADSLAEHPTYGNDVEEATPEYEDLDPVVVAERRARPPPIYDDLNSTEM